MKTDKKIITELLAAAGITINGKKPWDIRVNDEHIYQRVMKDGDIGIGEGYMLGEWDCDRIDMLTYKVNRAHVEEKLYGNAFTLLHILPQVFLEKVKPHNPFEIADKHYNLGNDLFIAMLGHRMVYTCAYWEKAKNLDEAQENKLDLVCRKLSLKKGMRVLDIGGGWGSFAKFAAEKYHVSVVNVSNSKEQVSLANKLCSGLPVENRLQDYHQISDKPYDRIVSLGMFEHVGSKHYQEYFDVVNHNLKDEGLFLLHTIGSHRSANNTSASWITKYIFPNSEIPTLSKLAKEIQNKYVLEDLHNFGSNYDKTLMTWYANFKKHWPTLKKSYDEKFYRMWKLYLLGSAGAFRARNLQLWQLVLSKNGIVSGYHSVR